MNLSSFGRILRTIVESTPGVEGAVFTDSDGEPVDQYAFGETLEIQIAGAQWGLALRHTISSLARAGAGKPEIIHVLCDHAQVFVRSLPEGYFVVIHARFDVHIGQALQNLERAVGELEKEML